MNLAILQALALHASIFNIKEHQVVDLGIQHPFFSGVMVNPIEGVDINEVVSETFEVLGRSFMWICDQELEGAARVFPFYEMELKLDELKEPKEAVGEYLMVSSEDLIDWKKVVGPTYEFDKEDIDAFANLYKGNNNFFHMVVKVNDVVVGAGTLQIYQDVAILHNITTLREARGKGIGSRISFELLSLAKTKNCTRSLIHGSSGAEKMYQRLGYKTQKIVFANFFKTPFQK